MNHYNFIEGTKIYDYFAESYEQAKILHKLKLAEEYAEEMDH